MPPAPHWSLAPSLSLAIRGKGVSRYCMRNELSGVPPLIPSKLQVIALPEQMPTKPSNPATIPRRAWPVLPPPTIGMPGSTMDQQVQPEALAAQSPFSSLPKSFAACRSPRCGAPTHFPCTALLCTGPRTEGESVLAVALSANVKKISRELPLRKPLIRTLAQKAD